MIESEYRFTECAVCKQKKMCSRCMGRRGTDVVVFSCCNECLKELQSRKKDDDE